MKEKSLGNTRALVNAALLAAVYAAITYMTKPISFGAVQFGGTLHPACLHGFCRARALCGLLSRKLPVRRRAA